MAPKALHVEEKMRSIVKILSTSGQFKSMYLTDASLAVTFACSRGLQTHVALRTRAGVHSSLIRCARCMVAEMHARTHATDAEIASKVLIACRMKKKITEIRCMLYL